MTGTEITILVVALIFLIFFIGGAIQTFQRNWVVALLLMFIVFPAWFCWAFVEMFLSKPQEEIYRVKLED